MVGYGTKYVKKSTHVSNILHKSKTAYEKLVSATTYTTIATVGNSTYTLKYVNRSYYENVSEVINQLDENQAIVNSYTNNYTKITQPDFPSYTSKEYVTNIIVPINQQYILPDMKDTGIPIIECSSGMCYVISLRRECARYRHDDDWGYGCKLSGLDKKQLSITLSTCHIYSSQTCKTQVKMDVGWTVSLDDLIDYGLVYGSTYSDESSTPHVESSTPQGESSTPQVESSTPQVESSTPHVESSTPHVDSSTPHVDSSTPHVESSTPHVESSVPQVKNSADIIVGCRREYEHESTIFYCHIDNDPVSHEYYTLLDKLHKAQNKQRDGQYLIGFGCLAIICSVFVFAGASKYEYSKYKEEKFVEMRDTVSF